MTITRVRVAIVVAVEREVRSLVKGWRVDEREHCGRAFRFFENGDAVLVCGGIGREAARRAAEAVIAFYSPGVVWSAGFAGALETGMKVGDVVVPARVIDSSDGSSVGLESGSGVLVSFEAVASPGQKLKLRESFGAQAVDMEAAAVARASQLHGVRFATVKVISDESDFTFPELDRFVDGKGRFLEGRFAVYAAVRPWLWGKVVRLGRSSARASVVLCQWLRTALRNEL